MSGGIAIEETDMGSFVMHSQIHTFDQILHLYLSIACICSFLAIITIIIKKGLRYKLSNTIDAFILGGLLWPLSIWTITFIISKAIWNIIVKFVDWVLP